MFGSETFRDDYPFTFHFLERLSVLLFVAQNNVLYKMVDLETVDESQNLCKEHIQSMIIGYNDFMIGVYATRLFTVVVQYLNAQIRNHNFDRQEWTEPIMEQLASNPQICKAVHDLMEYEATLREN